MVFIMKLRHMQFLIVINDDYYRYCQNKIRKPHFWLAWIAWVLQRQGSCVSLFCNNLPCEWGSNSTFNDKKSHCYSGLLAEGAVIESILANKQRFIGTIEVGTVHRIMQWNLTGLHGATWAEELINVWGPAGEICARLCQRSQLTCWSSHCNIYSKMFSST